VKPSARRASAFQASVEVGSTGADSVTGFS
jgi:hypothetical protein